MKNKIFILLIILVIPAISFSQEIITGLYTNPVIKANIKNMKARSARSIMLNIPFFDDFSGNSIFPNDSLWADKNVFINTAYPYMPPTIGVATFDALNDTGAIYPSANSSGFTADTLTSNPIRLDSITGAHPVALNNSDNIYFSFYYQPQGDTVLGNAPERDDSLVLEFYSPKTNQWNHVWADTGSTLKQFHYRYHKWFKQVLIPITDTTYFHKGFRFRFYNWASIANNSIPSWQSGNVDIWNLDYVYLNKDRKKGDSIYNDIAFVNPAPSVLKNYYSMPWSQYKVDTTAEMKDSLYMVMTNLDDSDIQIKYKYNVFDEFGNILLPGTNPISNPTYPANLLYPYATNNILALSQNQFLYGPSSGFPEFNKPPVTFKFPPSSADSATFTIVHRVQEASGNLHNENDSIVFIQKFYNYYAYDDGVPEAGYGLSPANAMLAYQFKLNKADTLRAVEMYFNQTLNNASQQYFYLTVWKDANGYPGDTLYQQMGVKPKYGDSLNKFVRYRIDDRKVLVSGTFYVGWKQTTDDNLNLGFDLNNDEHKKIFYNVGNGWMNSNYAGALMMRPVLGKVLPLVAGIKEIASTANEIKVFPNPSTGENISIDIPDSQNQDISKFTIHVFNMIGNEVYESPFTKTLNVSNLQNGIYLISVTSNNNNNKYFARISIIK
jgi:hypothetical protein